MKDASDRKRRDDRDLLERLQDRPLDQGWRTREARSESARLRKVFGDDPQRGSHASDQLARQERIREQSSLRHLADFDPRREAALEDREIRQNPEGYLRRHAGQALDAATERTVWEALQRDERKVG